MRKKIQIATVVLVLVAILVSVLWIRDVRSRIHDLPSIMDSGRLSVLTDSSRLGFATKGDSAYGFQYEIVKAFADTLGLELVISEQNDLKSCLKELESGDYDIIANLIPVTTEWNQRALFTKPLMTAKQVLVQRIEDDTTQLPRIKTHHQLAKDSIYIQYNSPFKMRLQHLSDEIADTIHIFEVKNLNTEQLVRLVAEKKIKYTICDEQFARVLKERYPNIDISLPLGFEQQLAWVVHPKSVLLLEKLNAFLDDFIGSSAYWEIYRKYY